MGTAILIVLGILGIGLALAVNYAIWFILLPIQFRQMRETFRRIRERRASN